MTEQEIAETLNERRAVDGIEIAEEIVWQAYDAEYSAWNGTGDDGNIEQVNELEQAMVALRVARELLSSGVFDDELLQRLATQVPCEDADIDSIEAAADLFQEQFDEKGEGVTAPSGPSIGSK